MIDPRDTQPESAVIRAARLAATRCGARLFRNNCGVAVDAYSGRPVRFGLCRGSSDLIGWVPVTVRPEHVGRTFAVFLAVECKAATGRATQEQSNFLERVRSAGGIAVLVRDAADLEAAIKEAPLPDGGDGAEG